MRHHLSRLIKSIRKISVKNRIIFSFYLTSIVPIVLIGIISYAIYFNSVRDKISDTTTQSLLLSEMNIDMAIERLESNSIEISFSDNAQNALRNYSKLSDYEMFTLEQKLQIQSAQQFTLTYFVSDVVLFTKDLETITAYGGRNRRLSLDKEYLETLVKKIKKAEGKSVFAVFEKDKKNPFNKVILMCRHINDIVTGERLGYIIISIDASYFQNICKAGTIGQSSYTMIVDQYNTIIASNTEKYLSGSNFPDKNLLNDLFLNEYNKKTFSYVFDNEKYILIYRELTGEGWFILSLIPYSYLNSETRVISLAILVIIIICILSAIVFSEIISKSIDKPLQTTLNLIDKVNSGDLSEGEYDDSVDEVAVVNRSFNDMIKRLSISMEEIRQTEKEKIDIKWQALMAQINPHFLANTLNSVRWLAHMQKAENIESLTSALINILQDTLGKEDNNTLEKEIQSIKDYITIQEYRYFDKFRTEFKINEESKDLFLPRFVLQPIVENAIIHGIAPKKGQGILSICSEIVDDNLLITITDDGAGMTAERIEQVMTGINQKDRSHFTNLGIKNVNERIKMKYGDSYGVTISSEEGKGTKVMLVLPIVKELG